MIERLIDLLLLLTSRASGQVVPLDGEVWQRHLETVQEMIGIYDEWQEMWRMLSVEDPNACVALAEELEHKNKTVHYDLDMDDLYERVRE